MGGIGTGAKAPKGTDFTTMSESEQLKKISDLQNQMGQTGYEAGNPTTNSSNKLYVNTGKSMCINTYLNTDGATYHNSNTDWDKYINEKWIKDAIDKMDKGMKPLPEDIKVYKYASAGALSKALGLHLNDYNINEFIQKLKTDKTAQDDFNKVLKNTVYVNKGYNSTTYVPEHGTFDKSPIRYDIIMRKGTDAIVTNNHAEHEIIGARNQTQTFTKFHVETVYSKALKKNIDQLVIECYI